MNSPNSEETIFAGALRLPPEQRAAFLDQAVGNDALRQRIDRLLKANEQAGGFLEEPAAPASDKATVLAVPLTEKAGDKIGRYKLLQQIGEGGCGVVYMAEQEQPVLRRVALKLIKLGMDTKQVIARFEAERQALAMMDHPNIARVLDAGATDTGRPYFVMELVRGVKITDYCDHNNLSTRERLDLFTKVCQAIQHAHQKGIIHRDIKPSNILVTLHDGVPVPKVIDFGIAKATQGRLTNKTLFTAFEQFIGTPAYVSPEQAEMSGLDIDTRSDIYSLGVLLYELLTGKTPFDASELLKAGFDQMRRTICEKEPERPSTKLSTMVEGELTSTAKRRHTDAPKLISAVRGDLDWIVMKCLEKDRARRYESANGLASDILRHVNNEPVVACPPSAAYRFQKLVRRNKLAFTATAAVTAALLIGLAVSTWMFFQEREAKGQQARLRLQAQAKEQEAQTARANEKKLRLQAQANEKKAETEAAKSAQVAQFLKDMLSGVRPEVALGRDTSILREILDNTAKRVGKELQDQPEVHASLLNIIGSTYHGIGEYAQGEAMQRQALALWRRTRGNESAEVADSLCHLGSDFFEEGKASAMETVVRESLEIRMKLFRSDSREVADCLAELGLALEREGKLTEAEAVQQKALTMRRKLFGEDHEDVAFSLNALGNVLRSQHRLVESEEMYRKALDMRQRLLGKEGGSSTQRNLAMVLADEGKFAEAERHMREAADLTRKRLGKDHPAAVAALRSLAGLLKSQGKTTEAEPLYREVLERYAKLADQGKAEAQFFIGAMYAHGEGVDKDMIEAIKWYGKAAEQGNPAAQYLLGSIYHNGSGVATNLVEAFNWWRKAAEQGIADAQYDLGVMYEQGKGVTKDLTQAVQWYRKAADQGDAGAQYNVANFYQNGKGVPKDIAEALKWYRLSADQGHSPAQNNLGVMYLEGQGVEKNPVEAAGWYRQAAEQSNEVAQCNLAGMYLRGDGVAKDPVEAAFWYRKSAEQGYANAQGVLGVLYYRGEGVPKDDVEAAKWWCKAVEQGDVKAEHNVGVLYERGSRSAKDAVRSWWRRLAEQGNLKAQERLARIYATGEGVLRDEKEAAGWYREVLAQYRRKAESGDAQELNAVAWLLATCPVAEVRDGRTAVAFAEKAVAASSRKDPAILDTLAAAYAETGEFGKAVSVQEEAMGLVEDLGLKDEIASHRRLYAARKPYREIDYRALNQAANELQEQGKLTEAETNLRQTLAIAREQLGGQHPTALELMINLGELLKRQNKTKEAEQIFDQLANAANESQPASAAVFRVRGEFFTRQARWKEAAPDVIRYAELNPDNDWAWREAGAILVRIGQIEAYREHCRKGQEKFSKTTDYGAAERIAKDCLILPSSGADLEVVAKMADTAIRLEPTSKWNQFAKGLAEYRQGRFASAVEWMNKTLTGEGPQPSRDVQAQMVLAMAHYQLKQIDEANAAFAEGVRIAESTFPKQVPADIGTPDNGRFKGLYFVDWIIAETLIREARTLVGSAPTTTAASK